MMKINFIALVFTGALLVISSCGDDDTNDAAPLTRTEMLTGDGGKIWKMVAASNDGVDALEDCMKDDEFVFYKDSTAVQTLNVDCFNDSLKFVAYEWSFIEGEDKFAFGRNVYEILSLTLVDFSIQRFYEGDSLVYSFGAKK